MVDLYSDHHRHAATRLQQTSKNLFSCGRFEKPKSLPVKSRLPSTAHDCFCSKNRIRNKPSFVCEHGDDFNTSSLPYLDAKQCRLHPPVEDDQKKHVSKGRKSEEELEEESVSTILENFSLLAAGILGIWEGDNSVRGRIDSLGARQQLFKDEIRTAEEEQEALKERVKALEQQAREEHASLERLREERVQTLRHGEATMKLSNRSCIKESQEYTEQATIQIANRLKGANYGEEFKHSHILKHQQGEAMPDLKKVSLIFSSKLQKEGMHLKRLIFSSRQVVAFEMLEFAHKRLTSHMWAHISETLHNMEEENDKAAYLDLFRREGPFRNKPMSEATYAELLNFVDSSRNKKIRKLELMQAMAAAEKKLVAEAEKEGYRHDVGDIRAQMAIYLLCHRQFQTSAIYHPSFHNKSLLSDGELTRDIVLDTQQAAENGRLGVLQPAAHLIHLGCYFLCRDQPS